MSSKADRPFLVTVLAVLYILAGVVLVVGGIAVMAGGITLDLDEFDYLAGAGGGVVAVVGIISLIIGAGFYKGWSIMWYLGVILSVIGVLIELASLVLAGLVAIVPLVINIVVLWYLFRPNVKSFFLDRARTAPAGAPFPRPGSFPGHILNVAGTMTCRSHADRHSR